MKKEVLLLIFPFKNLKSRKDYKIQKIQNWEGGKIVEQQMKEFQNSDKEKATAIKTLEGEIAEKSKIAAQERLNRVQWITKFATGEKFSGYGYLNWHIGTEDELFKEDKLAHNKKTVQSCLWRRKSNAETEVPNLTEKIFGYAEKNEELNEALDSWLLKN